MEMRKPKNPLVENGERNRLFAGVVVGWEIILKSDPKK
jgi:hypothetical protein